MAGLSERNLKTDRRLRLSEIRDAEEPNLMIESMLNQNQSVEQHSARMQEQSENAWTVKKLGAIEIFNNMEEIVYEILDNVIGAEVSPEIVKDNGKRKRSSDQEDKEFLNSEKIKKIKLNPQNLQKKSEKKITNPKKKENIQIEKENTTPAPIYNFLNQFNFR